MNAKILAVANQKGGVGKTTTSLNLGGALARQGKKVLLLDLDPHACATLNARIYPEDMGLSLHDIFLAREEDWPVLWPQVTHVDALEGMDVAPGNIRLSELEVDFRERRGKGGVLARSLAEQRRNYDFIVLDCPPHVGILLVNALVAADLLIIPIQTDFLALHGLKLLFDTLHTLRRALGRPIRYRAVPTMYDKRAKACTKVLELMRNKMDGALFSTIIGVDTHFREASARGCTIYGVDAHSRGARAYESLAEEVLALW
ncbi:ParA family protein [Desulfovibrio legallii]|jgi:chromosome partitioning protein|uniref:ParA family protein n=1 Tax=Desulfovibrio legallii TaxID=571438 RepID=A0A6H3FC65_9BACT|nr:ParA family protein [Desulfovibrio legallii]RHH26306.1 ParA family protein [Desulfovibrio sp. AM18-2]TBH81761.1 ParA family protein [Desulfovibrio legallii]CAI3226729.1 ParA-like protein [Desulfovibrio diazotrophicus]